MIYGNKYSYSVNYWALKLELIKELTMLHSRLPIDTDIILHYGVEGEHSKNSFHYTGMAVDLHFERYKQLIKTTELFEFLVKEWIGGIGVYPHWNAPGFHLDIGPVGRMWYQNEKGKYLAISDYIQQFMNKEVI